MASSPDPSRQMNLSRFVCANCRQRKIKCHRQLPQCSFCVDASLPCSYDATSRKRGLRAGYVASLEERVAKLEKELSSMRRMISELQVFRDPVNLSPTTPQTRPNHNVSPSATLMTISDSNGADWEDFDALPPNAIDELCTLWFHRYHPWFPILHRLSFLESVKDRVTRQEDTIAHNVVLKAILAITIPSWSSAHAISQEQRLKITTRLQTQVIMHASTNLSLQSLQAALIITNIDYGAGNLHRFWNVIAVCKRIGTHLGLRDLVANHGENYNKLSTIPPRMLTLPRTVIEQEERLRAYWMTELLDSVSTLGAGWNLGVSLRESNALLPCNETVWAFSENTEDGMSPLDIESVSLFSLYVILVTEKLHSVHAFLQHSFNHQSLTERTQRQAQCTALDKALTDWKNSEVVVDALRAKDPASDALLVLFNATFSTAVVVIYDRMAFPVMSLGDMQEPWYHAIQRCLDGCSDIAESIRKLDRESLENTSPLLAYCIFVAVRFLLVHSKTLAVNIPRCLNLLIYGLNVCAQRWHFARRLERVLRMAILEEKTPMEQSCLPPQFYDLQYSSIDIDEALRIWVSDNP